MFHKICWFMVVAVSCWTCRAEYIPEVVTSEVFGNGNAVDQYEEQVIVPAWPIKGSDADVKLECNGNNCDGITIKNNINTWSGGPDIINNVQIPAGFDNECADNVEMPLLRREMLEDDGGTVLSVSRSSHKYCNNYGDSYSNFAQRVGFNNGQTCNKDVAFTEDVVETEYVKEQNENDDMEGNSEIQNQVRSWVVTDGQTLREVLEDWGNKEGWDLVWTTSREYPIEASAVFKGRFVDVAAALIRNFERATPVPYAKFYKGNRVIVVSTSEE